MGGVLQCASRKPFDFIFSGFIEHRVSCRFGNKGITKVEHIQELRAYFAASKSVTIVIPEKLDWENENEIYKKIASFDVGVAPLLDTPVNQAKSAFKLKQYLSCGVPALGCSVGENTTFLQHGVNGYCCNDANDYQYYIKHIANMDDASYSMLSANALKTRSQYNMQHYCNRLLECLNG